MGFIRGPILGRGSTATVSLATGSKAEVFAVKSAELERSALLQREQRILSSLSSPHVVSCLGFDVTVEKGRSFYNLFMEYVDGGSVSDEVERSGGGMEEWRIRKYVKGILMGVSYLHSVGIAHCDVKGRNVLIGSDGEAQLADLGCARWVSGGDGGEDRCRVFGGTPVFMAPEVARGEEQGMAADVWAVGCTVIEMATGRPPWPELSDPVSAVHRIAFSADVPEFPKWISNEGRDFLSRCLRRDPTERWSADELLLHPFVLEDEEFQSLFSPKPNWRSPKCVLDQDIWDSMDEEESEPEEEKQRASIPADRIRQLGSGSGVSCLSWDDDTWITVRSGGGGGDGCSTSSVTAGGDTDNLTPLGAAGELKKFSLSSIGSSVDYSKDVTNEDCFAIDWHRKPSCFGSCFYCCCCCCLKHMPHVDNSTITSSDVVNNSSCHPCDLKPQGKGRRAHCVCFSSWIFAFVIPLVAAAAVCIWLGFGVLLIAGSFRFGHT